MSGIESEVKNIISIFYQTFVPEMERWKYLELVDTDPISESVFYDKLVNAHREIRLDTSKKTRYFILRKVSKLNLECKNKLPEINVVNNLSTSTTTMYWEAIQQSYMLLESVMDDKNDAVINTIAVELKKIADTRVEEEQKVLQKQVDAELSNARKMKKLNKKIDEIALPDTSALMEKASGVIDPQMMALFQGMMSNGTLDTSGIDINEMMKKTLSENSQYASLFSSLLEGYNSTNGEFSLDNITSVLNSVVEKISDDKPEYVTLINKIYTDMLYIYEKKSKKVNKKVEKITTRINNVFEKYKTLLERKSFSMEELIGCVWKIANDEEKRAYIEKMEKEEITSATIKTLIKKHIPTELLSQSPINIDTIIDMVFTGDMTNLSSMLDVAKNWMSVTTDKKEEEKLTDAQMAELEAFYDQTMK